eukprot:1648019-Amphidinium_carterae.1
MRHHAELPPQLQLRGDRAPAQNPDGRLERFYQIYIDNVDVGEIQYLGNLCLLSERWTRAIEDAASE